MQARARGAWRTQVTAARCAPSLAGPPLRRGRGSCGGRRGPPVAAGLGAGQARAPRPLLGQRPEKPEHPGPAAEGLTGGVRSRPRGGGGGGGCLRVPIARRESWRRLGCLLLEGLPALRVVSPRAGGRWGDSVGVRVREGPRPPFALGACCRPAWLRLPQRGTKIER